MSYRSGLNPRDHVARYIANALSPTQSRRPEVMLPKPGLAFGDYVVTEQVPAGYVSDDAVKKVNVSEDSTCGDGNEAEVSLHNTPLTNVTVSVDSQVDGGTASTIDCGGTNTTTTGPDGDGSLTVNDLQPTAPAVTLTCTITTDP